MAVINNSKYIMLLCGNKGKGREKGKIENVKFFCNIFLKKIEIFFCKYFLSTYCL